MDLETLRECINNLDCELVEKKCYDAASGWTGKDLYVKSKKNGLYLHENGKFEDVEPKWQTFNISSNGYQHQSETYDSGYKYVSQAVKGLALDLILLQEMSSPLSALERLFNSIEPNKKDKYVNTAYVTVKEKLNDYMKYLYGEDHE